jgi:hypothetical protein
MIGKGWFAGGDFIEFFGRRYYAAFAWKQPLRIFNRYAWGIERGWAMNRWIVFAGWFIVGRREVER